MPQIAQQDYIVIAPKPGRPFIVDAAALGELKKAILNGIAFDCILKDIGGQTYCQDRVLGIYPPYTLVISDAENGAVAELSVPYTVEQYSGLAAVQEAEDEYSGGVEEVLPSFSLAPGGYLNEYNEGIPICVNGFRLSVTASVGTIATLEISDTKPIEGDDFINIAWEDALKLIGLPLN